MKAATTTTAPTTTAPTTTKRRGFSLMEVMTSATILIVGISSLVLGVHVAIGQHEHNRKMAIALAIAEERMEALLLLFPTSSDLADGRHPETGFESFNDVGRPVFVGDPALAEKGGFRAFYIVTPSAISADEVPIIGLRIDLTVTWNEALGARSLVLRTAR